MTQESSRRQFLRTSVSTFGAGLLLRHPLVQQYTGRATCPILMYHYVGELPEGADRYRRDLTVTPQRFAEHLDALTAAGFSSVSMADLWAALKEGTPLPERPVILSFDDGYSDAYTCATPLLLERGMRGSFFVITGRVGQPGYLTWGQAQEMAAAGMEIGSHSATHPDLTTLDQAAIEQEILGSTDAIITALGHHPRYFCYPLGRYDRRVIAALRDSGYVAALTTRDGTIQTAASPYTLRRARVRGGHTARTVIWLASRSV